ncbi:hypothetical protein DFP87_110113, partial [Achromobacter marplatensis]
EQQYLLLPIGPITSGEAMECLFAKVDDTPSRLSNG